jgi:hypothetical protein
LHLLRPWEAHIGAAVNAALGKPAHHRGWTPVAGAALFLKRLCLVVSLVSAMSTGSARNGHFQAGIA